MRTLELPAGKIKRIHVYGQRIRTAKKTGEEEPFFIVKYRGKSIHCRRWKVFGTVDGQQGLDGMPGCRHAVAWLSTTDRMILYLDDHGPEEAGTNGESCRFATA